MKTDQLAPMERKSAAEVTEGVVVPEIKAAKNGTIEGYGAVFSTLDTGGDIILPGAFAESLAKNPTVKMLWQHDPHRPIGVWDEVKEDEKGLYVKGRILGDVEKGKEALALISAGAMDGLSIGYRTIKASRDAQGNRLLEQVEIWEVSTVTFPMNTVAKIDAVKAAAMEQREFERKLGEGFPMSRSVVAALMRDGFKGVQALSDSGDEDYSELLDVIHASSLIEHL